MPETDDKQKPKSARWVYTLSGIWSTETYGIVEFLRIHKACRIIVGTLGIIACIVAASSLTGLKIPGLTFSFFPFVIVGPWLVLIATISGPHFSVTFPSREAAQEREKAQKQF